MFSPHAVTLPEPCLWPPLLVDYVYSHSSCYQPLPAKHRSLSIHCSRGVDRTIYVHFILFSSSSLPDLCLQPQMSLPLSYGPTTDPPQTNRLGAHHGRIIWEHAGLQRRKRKGKDSCDYFGYVLGVCWTKNWLWYFSKVWKLYVLNVLALYDWPPKKQLIISVII